MSDVRYGTIECPHCHTSLDITVEDEYDSSYFTVESTSPMVGGINHDTTMTAGDGEHSEGDSGTHP
jgi:hypothetical protein